MHPYLREKCSIVKGKCGGAVRVDILVLLVRMLKHDPHYSHKDGMDTDFRHQNNVCRDLEKRRKFTFSRPIVQIYDRRDGILLLNLVYSKFPLLA